MIASLALALLQSRPASGPAEEGRWLTDLGERVLSRCEMVVLAKVRESTELGGARVARLEVERRLGGGGAPGSPLVLAPRGSLLPGDSVDLFFLERRGEAGRFGVVGTVQARDPDFASKLGIAEETLAIAALPDPAARLARARLLLHRGLAGEDAYARASALLEAERWAARFPWRLGPEDRDRFAERAARTKDPSLRRRLERLARTPDPLGKPGG